MPIVLLSIAASAADAPPPAAAAAPAAPPALVAQLGASAELRRIYHALTAKERAEFNQAFSLYERHVARRLSQGWVFHDDPAVNNSIGRLHIPDEVVALSLHDARKELAEGKAWLAQFMAHPDRQGEPRARWTAARIEDLQRDLKRVWGTCGDWSGEIRDSLLDRAWTSLDIGHTEMISTNALLHKVLGAAGEHASVRVCGKASGLCAVFDPWRTGRAVAQGPLEWLDGGSIKICMSGVGNGSRYCR